MADTEPIRDVLDQADEDALAEAFGTAISQVRGRVLDAVVRAQYAHVGVARFADDPARLPSPDDAYQDVWWTDAVDEHVAARMRTIIQAAGLKSSDLFAPEGALASKMLEQHVALIESWSDGQRAHVVEVFDRALTEGWSVDRISAALVDSGALSGTAADVAARTEAVAAANAGVIAGWRADPQTAEGWKRWTATHDGRTRESHNTADKQTVRISEQFELDAGLADYPGDVTLPPEERCNCRCAVVYLDPNDPDAPRAEQVAPVIPAEDVTASAHTMSAPDHGGTTMATPTTTTDPGTDVPASSKSAGTLSGPVTVEGVRSGDGRVIAANALEFVDNAPVMFLDRTTWGHDDAVLVGRATSFTRKSSTHDAWDGQSDTYEIESTASLMDTDLGRYAKYVSEFMDGYGVSVDVDNATCEYPPDPLVDLDTIDPEELWWWGPPCVQVVTKGRVVGYTLCPFPAFQEARMRSLTSNGAVLANGATAPGGRLQFWMPAQVDIDEAAGTMTIRAIAPTREAILASGARQELYAGDPPYDWFVQPETPATPYPWRVDKDGHAHGYVALWGQRHIAFGDRTITVPKARDGYRAACNKQTWVSDGPQDVDSVWTTAVFVNGGFHAPADASMTGAEAQAWYAANSVAAADVALYEDRHGIYATGAVRPGIDRDVLRELSSSDVSPDWRWDRGGHTCYGLLSVGTSGFVVPAESTNAQRGLALVASGARNHGGVKAQTHGRIVERDGVIVTMQGLGRVPRSSGLAQLAADVAWIKERVVAQEAAAARERLAAALEGKRR